MESERGHWLNKVTRTGERKMTPRVKVYREERLI